ncbi:hypothetical protein [Roseococcus pinisoli]|uniref:Uncharacterized protein n=1 Tax=Roseococcus pinisoli TaxID=2835040 RepID=A0ABS5QET8_9PROT|nr:hypothetical protein [Roseococcus pinisoli]MBS7812206.1 hypothetical protein [Roseococcus pinisoli]
MVKKPTSTAAPRRARAAKSAQAETVPAEVELAPEAEDEPTPLATLTHPEEMRATVDVQLSSGSTLKATARWTPAGVVTMGVTMSSILLSAAAIVWASRRRP